MKSNTLLFVFMLDCFFNSLGFGQQLIRKSDRIIIQNDLIKREIFISSSRPSSISNSITSKNKIFNASNKYSSWFEIGINNKIVKSEDYIWQLIDVAERKMLNGGKEFSVNIKCTSGPVIGLIIKIPIQCYANNDFFRERIIFSSENEQNKLTKIADKVHFIFAAFDLRIPSKEKVLSGELRLASWNGQLIKTDYSSSFDNKVLEGDWRAGRNLEQNYMYHSKRIESELKKSNSDIKLGPFSIISLPQRGIGFWSAFEHGAPDLEPDQRFVEMKSTRKEEFVSSSISIINGAYKDNQKLSDKNIISSPWYSIDFYEGASFNAADKEFWKYLQEYICEIPNTRKPLFYYNTWGMQRDESTRGNDIRGILTESKIKQEIDEASDLGIDLFVLDDGWQDNFGDWNSNKERLPNGLKFYFDHLKDKGIMPGLWIAPLATDPNAEITKLHPEWLIRDDKGEPFVGQWKMNFFCFNTEFKNYFIQKCKTLIDQGVRYFKWDGVNTYLCQERNHNHGGEFENLTEIQSLHGYSLPLEITDAIRQLKEYQKDLIIEIDVTEANRNVGLAYLSEARYFWMNNGAGWYGEYSTYRGKSTRMITNSYGSFLPTTLQTFACFPMYDPVYKAQTYNVNSSLIGGRGFWGNISRMTLEERERVGKRVKEIKLVEEASSRVYPKITGRVGSSPEVYEFYDNKISAGKVIAFSGSALQSEYSINNVNESEILGVLENSFSFTNNKLKLNFEFYSPDDSKIAIILPNNRSGISITLSTSWLKKIELIENKILKYIIGAPGKQKIHWPKSLGTPIITGNFEIESDVSADPDGKQFTIGIVCKNNNATVTVMGK